MTIPMRIQVIILVLAFSGSKAQTNFTFQVVDETDQSPVPFASIYIPDQRVGFSASANGFFTINIGDTAQESVVIISSLGYEEFRSTVKSLSELKDPIIPLSPNFTLLDEILIKAKKENPEDVVEKVGKSLKKQLGQDPYYLYAFYKESIKVADQFAGYTEGYGILHVSGYQPGFNRRNELFAYDLAQWKNIRRSDYKIQSDCDTSNRTMGIEKLLLAKANYLYSGPLNKNLEAFDFTVDSVFKHKDDEILVISFAPKTKKINYSGVIWITNDDNTLVSLKIKDTNFKETISAKCSLYDSAIFELGFVKFEENHYLNHASLISYSTKNKKPVWEELILRGGEFRDDKTEPLNYDQRMVIFNEMVNPVIRYDEQFWKTHGDSLPEKLKADLGAEIPVAEQFFKMNGQRIIPLPGNYDSYEDLYKEQDMFQIFMLNSDF